MSDTTHPVLREAIIYLAGHCDGAFKRDNEGYSKSDAAYGARLAAELPEREATADEQIVMLEVLETYQHTQLAPAGIVLPTYPELCEYLGVDANGGATPAMRESVLNRLKVDELRRTRGSYAAEQERLKQERAAKTKAEREQLAAAPAATVRSTAAGVEIELTKGKPDFGAILSAVREIPGRRYSPDPVPHWTVPVTQYPALTAALESFNVAWPAETPQPAAPSEAQTSNHGEPRATLFDTKPENLRKGIIRTLTTKTLSFEFPYDPEMVALSRQVPGRRWDGERKINTCPVDSLPHLIRLFPDMAMDEDVARIVEHERQAREQSAAERDDTRRRVMAALAQLDIHSPIPYDNPRVGRSEITLFAHQRQGIPLMIEQAFTERQTGCLNADDMGLGKTLQALIAAKAFQLGVGAHVIVVCRASLREMWQREAAAVGVRAEFCSMASIPPPPDGHFVAIFDEAHNYANWGYFKKDGTTKGVKRTARMVRLAQKAICVLHLTGSPMPNGRPAEATALLLSTRHRLLYQTGLTSHDKRAYEERFCGAHIEKKGRFDVWDVSGAAHMDEWARETHHWMIRRYKKDCLDLPAKTRVMLPIDISKEAQAIFDETIHQRAREYHARVENGHLVREQLTAEAEAAREQINPDFENGEITEKLRDVSLATIDEELAEAVKDTFSPEGQQLVFITHYRTAASLAKVGGACEIIDQILHEGRQVVVFTEYAESAREIAIRYNVTPCDGNARPTKRKNEDASPRQQIVDRFQAGTDRVFVGTIATGGEGLTLHADGRCADVILLDRPWTPGKAEQAEDRVYRIGQTSPVTAHWAQAFDIDTKVDEILLAKQDRIDLMINGKRKTLRGVKNLSARKLALELFDTLIGDN